MSKTVFISRALDESSVFSNRLQAAGWAVQDFSLVTLAPLPVPDIPAADWIFFASGNAVRFFFGETPPPTPPLKGRGEASLSAEGDEFDARHTQNNPDTERATPPLPFRGGVGGGVSWAALGPATARELKKFTGRVDFTGTGDPVTTADMFRSLAAGQRVLFPAARHSQRSIPEALGDAITALHLAVYDNAPAPAPPRIDAGVLVFTSPMNAVSYFTRHALQTHQRVVAIGKTTAGALAGLGIAGFRIAAEPSEFGLAEAVLFLGQ